MVASNSPQEGLDDRVLQLVASVEHQEANEDEVVSRIGLMLLDSGPQGSVVIQGILERSDVGKRIKIKLGHNLVGGTPDAERTELLCKACSAVRYIGSKQKVVQSYAQSLEQKIDALMKISQGLDAVSAEAEIQISLGELATQLRIIGAEEEAGVVESIQFHIFAYA